MDSSGGVWTAVVQCEQRRESDNSSRTAEGSEDSSQTVGTAVEHFYLYRGSVYISVSLLIARSQCNNIIQIAEKPTFLKFRINEKLDFFHQ